MNTAVNIVIEEAIMMTVIAILAIAETVMTVETMKKEVATVIEVILIVSRLTAILYYLPG